MIRTGLFLLAFAPVFNLFGEEPAEKLKFEKLYNGKDLSGWEVKDGDIEAWLADGELLSSIKEGGGWLRTKEQYSDFVLKLDFRIPKGGNSGVGLRFPIEGDPAHVGMEVQVLDDDAPEYANLKDAQYSGGIYYQAPAKKGFLKPIGEWNTYEITCRGPHVKVMLNGEVINEINIDEFTKGEGGYLALIDRPQVGYIGFQNHGSRVDYRNIELANLSTKTKSGLEYLDLKIGEGEEVKSGKVTVSYSARLTSGKLFESKKEETINLNAAIPGLQEGLKGMKAGGRRKLVIPGQLAFKEKGVGDIVPTNATVVYDIEVVK